MEELTTQVMYVTADIAKALGQYRRYRTRLYVDKKVDGLSNNHLVLDTDMTLHEVLDLIKLCPDDLKYTKYRVGRVWDDKLFIKLNPGTHIVLTIPEGYEVHPENYKKVRGVS